MKISGKWMKLENIIPTKLWQSQQLKSSIWFQAAAPTRDIPIPFSSNIDHQHLNGLSW